jgi:hypothetical protein
MIVLSLALNEKDHPYLPHLLFNMAKGSRKNNFTFLALRFMLGLVDFKKQKAQ